MGKFFNVNSDELVKFSKSLELVSKKALPKAVMKTLNSMAFEVKKKTLLEESSKSFANRNKSFYKKFSRVEMARPGKLESMKSKVGMVANGVQAGFDQKQQQEGGAIKGRTLIPLDTARISKSNSKNVKKQYRVKNLTVHLDSADSRGSNSKKRFVQTAISAIERFGSGANIKHKKDDGKVLIYNVKKGGSDIKTSKYNIKITPLYSVQEGRAVRITKPKPFVLNAAVKTRKSAPEIFKKVAERELKRIMK